MTSGDLPPEREEHLMTELLRDRAGIDPGTLGPVLDLAAIGLVNGTWRNTCVESWHVEGRMRDGDMLRVNSHTTWLARQLVRRWMRELGLEAADPTSALEGPQWTTSGGWRAGCTSGSSTPAGSCLLA